MENILFIIPPTMTYDRFVNPGFNERSSAKKTGRYGSPITDMPIGVLSLSAYLKGHTEVDVKLIDFNTILNKLESFNYNSFSSLYREIFSTNDWNQFVPDIIGISALFTTAYYNMMDIAEVVRDIFPESLILAGGGVPTNLHQKIFKDCNSFDALCFGEGEKPLLDLVRSDDKKTLLQTSQSWITKEKSASQDSFQYDFIDDLDEIPLYDYSLLDLEAYGLSPTLTNYTSFESNLHPFHFATSRGCPFHCCFCASHTVHGRKMRYYSIDRIREDLMHLKHHYGARIIGIQDDHLIANKKRVYEIIKIAGELKLQLYFQNGVAIHALDPKMLEAMKNAGVSELVLPIESGSSRVLRDIMKKPLDLSTVKRVVDCCRQLEIDTYANILIGLPGETKQDIEDTRVFLKSLNVTWFRIVVATPLVGSEMFETCIQKNYLNSSYIGCDFKNAVVTTEDFSAEYIEQTAYAMNLELNFVENSDFKLKNYRKALDGFENTIKVNAEHAFAHYFAAKCYKKMNLEDAYQKYRHQYHQLLAESAFWQEYASQFKLVALN